MSVCVSMWLANANPREQLPPAKEKPSAPSPQPITESGGEACKHAGGAKVVTMLLLFDQQHTNTYMSHIGLYIL